jgi:hypothetical protein
MRRNELQDLFSGSPQTPDDPSDTRCFQTGTVFDSRLRQLAFTIYIVVPAPLVSGRLQYTKGKEGETCRYVDMSRQLSNCGNRTQPRRNPSRQVIPEPELPMRVK